MNKKGYIILTIVGIILFILLYYITHDSEADNNFVNTKVNDTEEFTIKDADELGDYLVNEAVLFYEKTPGNTKKEKTIDGEEYLELESFVKDAEKIFSDKEIQDFINYYDIIKKNKKYYIKESSNELVYIYDRVSVRTKTLEKNRIEYRVDWEFCDAKDSSELSECIDTSAHNYKNTMRVEVIDGRWKITDFDLPDSKEDKEIKKEEVN